MRGFVLHEKGEAGWTEVPDPEVGPHGAVTRVTAAATCPTGVHMIATAAFPASIGKVIGHEAVGVFERTGEVVRDFKPGDCVLIPTGYSDWRHPRAARRGEVLPDLQSLLLTRPDDRGHVLRARADPGRGHDPGPHSRCRHRHASPCWSVTWSPPDSPAWSGWRSSSARPSWLSGQDRSG